MVYRRKDVEEIIKKYSSKLGKEINSTIKETDSDYSQDYENFKKESNLEFNRYEKLARGFGTFIKVKVAKKDEEEVRKQIKIAHLNIEPWQAISLSIFTFISVFLLGILISVALFLINGSISIGIFFLFTILSLFLFYFLKSYPKRLAKKWRLKASSQMVWAVLYVVIYMRESSNLEKAIYFASKNLNPPLSLDFKKIFYEVSTGKFSTIQDSLDNYLENWRDFSTEFVESFHLIESSLFEPNNTRRVSILDKSLQIILDGVYDNMLEFTHSVKAPLNNIYMLGIILPTLTIALLPIASLMLGGSLSWVQVMITFNLIIPFFVFYLTDKILMLRPGGQGNSSFLKKNKYYHFYRDTKIYLKSFFIALPMFLLGLLPLIFQYTPIPSLLGLKKDYSLNEIGLSFLGNGNIFGFLKTGQGPFGIISVILSLFIPLSIALFFVISYNYKTKKLIEERKKTEKLEEEFSSSLFQIGNRLGNGTPLELVFSDVANSSKGLITEKFFREVNYNIEGMGMSVRKAIFDENQGAIRDYPSDLIAMSMSVLIESVKKGLRTAARSIISISQYFKNIRKINSRLLDLLADIISGMKNNMNFLAPLLSGVVVGLAVMITTILGKLNLGSLGGGSSSLGNFGSIVSIFKMSAMIPPYFLQIIVGVYLIEMIFILTSALVVVKSGEDSLEEMNETGKNLKHGITLYIIISFLTIFILALLVNQVLGGLFS